MAVLPDRSRTRREAGQGTGLADPGMGNWLAAAGTKGEEPLVSGLLRRKAAPRTFL